MEYFRPIPEAQANLDRFRRQAADYHLVAAARRERRAARRRARRTGS